MKIVALLNNKGGVGRTSLVYHLGWAYADMGRRVLMADLDPQSTLTAMCITEDRLEELWGNSDEDRKSIRGAVDPIVNGFGDISAAHVEELSPRISLIPGDIRLASFEAKFAAAWTNCQDRDPAAFRIISSLYRVVARAARDIKAEIVLVDVGPNLGAITRATLIGATHVVTPLAADIFSVQGLRNLGPTLRNWRNRWQERLSKNPDPKIELPPGMMDPSGYVVMQLRQYAGRWTRAHERWLHEIPLEYHAAMLGEARPTSLPYDRDSYCLGALKNYHSLMSLAQEAQKPIFHLTAADGALGAHATAAREAGKDFSQIARRIAAQIQLDP